MFAFVIRRILVSIPVLIGSTILTFVLVKLSGNPMNYLLGRNPPVAQHTIDLERHRLGLDRSWPSQYWHWITGVLHGNFGQAIHPADNIGHELFSSLGVTARLVIVSVIISLILAVGTGIYSAVKQYSIGDYSVTFLGFLFLSMPVFWFAILLKQAGIWYNKHVSGHQTFATIGEKSVFLSNNSFGSRFADYFGHMVLPVIVLSLAGYAGWTRFTRASMLEVLNSDYVRLARSKGLKPRQVLIRHALRTALIPLTTVTALDIAALLAGAIVTEKVFQWHGMGNLFLTAVQNIDFNVMLAWLLVTATIVILFNLLADILYGVLDPRFRHA
ncbi:MAG: nickel transporter, permease subunit NikB [Pseudonocardiales bacterium]|nr:nickel transporter, permease subunit NikB [Pseudonocardiales bacterium]